MPTVSFDNAVGDGDLSDITGGGALDNWTAVPVTGDTMLVANSSGNSSGQLIGNCVSPAAWSGGPIIPAIWLFRFGPGGCTAKSLGTESTAVTLSASTHVKVQGNGYLPFANISAGTSGAKIAQLTITNVARVLLSTGDIDEIRCVGVGSVYIGAGVAFIKLRVSRGTRVFIESPSSSTTWTELVVADKSCEIRTFRGMANAATAVIHGRVDWEGTSSNGNSSSKAWVAPGAIFNDRSSGTKYNIELMPAASLTAEGAVQSPTWSGVKWYPGANIQRTLNGVTITISSEDPIDA